MSLVVERFLFLLVAVKACGVGWTARCPAHDDQKNSLSIREGDDGRVLVNCFAGCDLGAITSALGIETSDLFPKQQGAHWPPRIDVNALAKAKGLSPEFLRSLGLEDRNDGVVIPYRDMNGAPTPRARLRTALVAKQGSLWMFGKGKPVPYGLERLDDARRDGYVVLVEGESDLWTLYYHGIPALGIPGASMTKVLQADHLRDIERIFVVQEPDGGGHSFVDGVRRRLGEIEWTGHAFILTCGEFKDPNDWHRDDPNAFLVRFQDAMKSAVATDISDKKEARASVRDVDEVLAGLQNVSPAKLDVALRDLAESLLGADSLRRAVARESAIQQLKLQGINSPAKLVDAALGLSGENASERGPSFLCDPTPSSHAVEGSQLLGRLRDLINRFAVLPPGADTAIALWIVFVFCLPAFSISPILAILSPVKRCGKTTLIAILRALVPRALPASNITSAAVFRTIEHFKPTLLIDEADTFLSRNEELRGVINSGHTRATAMVIRTVGDNHDPKVFSTWCAKAIALIGRLSDTLQDRSIAIPMQRKARGENVERLRQDRLDAEFAELQSQAVRWAEDHLDDLRDADPEVPSELHDRAQDNWRPLLAIADLAGGEWPELARKIAIKLSSTASEADTAAPIQLLADIRSVFQDAGKEFLSSDELVKSLTSMEDRPWGEWRQGKPLTKIQLSRLVRRFDVSPRQTHRNGEKLRGYTLSQFDECFARYLPSESGQSGLSNDINELDEDSSLDRVGTVPSRVGTDAQQESSCPDSESGHPDSIPTGNLFESGQLGESPMNDRDDFDL